MTHLGVLTFFLFAFFGLSEFDTASAIPSATQAQTLPNPPPGFNWQESKNGIGTFLRPKGWHLKEEKKGDTSALFISREDINATGGFLVGLSVNKISNISKTQRGIKPSQFAKTFAAGLRKSAKVLEDTVVTGNFPEMNVVRVVLDKDGGSVIVHYITIGNDISDSAYVISFEAPESEWKQQFKLGREMLNFFSL